MTKPSDDDLIRQKSELRKQLRSARANHVRAIPDAVRALLFKTPPGGLADLIAEDAVIGLYHSSKYEAPMGAYARHFAEAGHRVALPRFDLSTNIKNLGNESDNSTTGNSQSGNSQSGNSTSDNSQSGNSQSRTTPSKNSNDPGGEMQFAAFSDPFGESDLQAGPYGVLQPDQKAEIVTPSVVFVPLLGFTQSGARLGQGGGHYDRWLADHPKALSIGVAWDVQLLEDLPVQAHDQKLSAIVTPTRFYGAL